MVQHLSSSRPDSNVTLESLQSALTNSEVGYAINMGRTYRYLIARNSFNINVFAYYKLCFLFFLERILFPILNESGHYEALQKLDSFQSPYTKVDRSNFAPVLSSLVVVNKVEIIRFYFLIATNKRCLL